MNILLLGVKIIDPNGPNHKGTKDILIRNGHIESVTKAQKQPAKAPKGVKVINEKGLHVFTGLFDIGADFSDPGLEHREDILSGQSSAAAGGYTGVAVNPNTEPAISSKSQVEYVLTKSNGHPVAVYPIGAISQNCEGKELTEMYDMHASGAIAFADGDHPLANDGFMMRALQYVTPFQGLIINRPERVSISHDAAVHEGKISTLMGMKGNPELSETLMIERDLKLLEYTNSRLHFSQVSTAKAVSLIREAKRQGLNISASVSPYHLAFLDEQVLQFNSHYKVSPPLRSEKDRKALIKGLKDGVIDCISSQHRPLNAESKDLEFEYAEPGMINLQTAFLQALEIVDDLELVVEKMSIQPRKVLGLETEHIKKGSKANLCLFQPKAKWALNKVNNQSKSNNSPYFNRTFNGKIYGVYNNGSLLLNS